MRNIVSFLAVGLTLAVFAPASRADIFTAFLAGSNENPSNTSAGTGFATITFDMVAQTMRVEVTFSDLTGNVTASHIHAATAIPFTGNAGIATQTPSFTGFPTGGTSGTYDHTFDMTLASSYNPAYISANGGSIAAAETSLFNSMVAGTSYFNIHSNKYPSGEIRGFLRQNVPEPGTLTLLTSFSIFSMGVIIRRRRV